MTSRYANMPDIAGMKGAPDDELEAYLQAELERSKGKPHVLYQRDPVNWLVDVLGFERGHIVWSDNPAYAEHRWDGTKDPLVVAMQGLANSQWVAVEAGTGTSKTYTLGAGMMLWFLACFEDSWVITGAPKEEQLKKNLWKEVTELWPRFHEHFPDAVLQSLSIRMRGGIEEGWAASGFVCGVGADEDSANRARGFHRKDMLWIMEEGPGIDDSIWTAVKNTSTAPHNLILGLGNPDHRQDTLHRFAELNHVVDVRISAYDFPNVVMDDPDYMPGAVSRVSIERRREEFDEGTPMFDRMVRGLAPAEAKNALIRWEWCTRAAEKYGDPAYRKGSPSLGVDVANSETGDEAAKAFWVGATLDEIISFVCPDSNVLGEEVAVDMALRGIDERNLGVDPVGVGAGTVNKLKELMVHGNWLNGAFKAWPEVDEHGAIPVRKEELFANLRAQMWWRMRTDLQHGRIALPDDEELFRDLCTPTYLTRGGKILVESKEEIVKRLKRSPNKGDAAVYGNFVRQHFQEVYEDPDFDAWDPHVLRREADECRRIRPTTGGGRVPLHPELGQLL